MVTAELLKPITETVTGNITTILPIGLTIMGAMLGITMVPKIIRKFL